MNETRMRELLKSRGLERIADQVAQAMQPSLRCTLTSGGGSCYDAHPPPNIGPIGISRVGGDPDLPPDFDWPHWEGIPLSFIAQINLTEIAALDQYHSLPPEGMLYVFYEATLAALVSESEEADCEVVHYNGDSSKLFPTPAPLSLPDYGRLLPCRMTFRREWTVPMMDSIEFNQFGLENLGEDWENYRLCYVDFTDERDADMPRSQPNELPRHRLLGCPDIMWNDGRLAAEWRLLFQIDSDNSAELNWGDAGFIYFFIHEDDLRNGRFDRVLGNYEGY